MSIKNQLSILLLSIFFLFTTDAYAISKTLLGVGEDGVIYAVDKATGAVEAVATPPAGELPADTIVRNKSTMIYLVEGARNRIVIYTQASNTTTSLDLDVAVRNMFFINKTLHVISQNSDNSGIEFRSVNLSTGITTLVASTDEVIDVLPAAKTFYRPGSLLSRSFIFLGNDSDGNSRGVRLFTRNLRVVTKLITDSVGTDQPLDLIKTSMVVRPQSHLFRKVIQPKALLNTGSAVSYYSVTPNFGMGHPIATFITNLLGVDHFTSSHLLVSDLLNRKLYLAGYEAADETTQLLFKIDSATGTVESSVALGAKIKLLKFGADDAAG